MNEYSIDLVVHAHDEGDTRYDKMYAVPINLGKFKRLDYTKSISTTEITINTSPCSLERCKYSI